MNVQTPLSAVGRTALAVAVARAVESERPDAWFDDELAKALVATATDEHQVPSIGSELYAWISVRTRFLDELVLASMADGVRQIVIVGAGLDARAFRLPLPADSAVYEFDRADVLEVKQRVLDSAGLQPASERTVIVGDILHDGWLEELEAVGWHRAEPTVWIVEGFLIYFDEEVRSRILRELAAASAPGSTLGATVSLETNGPRHPLWRSFDGIDFVAWFASCGWDAAVSSMPELVEQYGRELPVTEHIIGALISARVSVPALVSVTG